MRNNLAVIIPAYKKEFLDITLKSLERQTDKRFNVYVGDDNSPSDLKSICDKYHDTLNLNYVKFPYNIGAKHLVQQWNRCIELSKEEEWIWLFSDDDIADDNCVELFYSTIENDNKRFDVYRFNTRIIDDKGNLMHDTMESPFIDSSENMAYSILMGKRGNSMPDHIFSRNIYKKYGIVETDFAQAADWATSILFATDKGICSMQGAKVNWRFGNYNISGQSKNNVKNTLRGHIQFLIWTIEYFNYLKNKNINGISYNNILEATEFNLKRVIEFRYKKLPISNYFDLYKFYKKKNESFFCAVSQLNRLYLKYYYSKVKQFYSKVKCRIFR